MLFENLSEDLSIKVECTNHAIIMEFLAIPFLNIAIINASFYGLLHGSLLCSLTFWVLYSVFSIYFIIVWDALLFYWLFCFFINSIVDFLISVYLSYYIFLYGGSFIYDMITLQPLVKVVPSSFRDWVLFCSIATLSFWVYFYPFFV